MGLRRRMCAMSEQAVKITQRPKHLNLMQIRFPLPAIVSILHRLSGVALFLMLGVLLWLLQATLQSPESFAQVKAALVHPVAKLALLGLLWAYLHHCCAGIRHVLLDLHYGVDLETARFTSKLVLFGAFGVAVVLGVFLW